MYDTIGVNERAGESDNTEDSVAIGEYVPTAVVDDIRDSVDTGVYDMIGVDERAGESDNTEDSVAIGEYVPTAVVDATDSVDIGDSVGKAEKLTEGLLD